MYEILRVPPGPGHMRKAYDLIAAYLSSANRLEFKDFLDSTKSVYMIADNCCYYGMGWVCLKTCPSEMATIVKVRPYNSTVYSLNLLTFTDDGAYNKLYDLIRTLMKDCADKVIIVENVANEMKDAINALKNNGFKVFNTSNQYSNIFYKIPGGNIVEKKFKIINPKDDLDTIDKHICLCDGDNRITELQSKYTSDLLAKNIEESENTSCTCGCENCTCGKDIQTAEEFLGSDINCKCHECKN